MTLFHTEAPPYVADEAPPVIAPQPPTAEDDAPLPPGGSSPRRWRGPATLVVVALLSGTTGAALTRTLDDDEGAPPATGAAARAVQLDGETLDVAAVAAKAGPSVVAIRTEVFGGAGAGTGVILTADGEILTNAHVVNGASTVKVT